MSLENIINLEQACQICSQTQKNNVNSFTSIFFSLFNILRQEVRIQMFILKRSFWHQGSNKKYENEDFDSLRDVTSATQRKQNKKAPSNFI